MDGIKGKNPAGLGWIVSLGAHLVCSLGYNIYGTERNVEYQRESSFRSILYGRVFFQDRHATSRSASDWGIKSDLRPTCKGVGRMTEDWTQY